MRCASPRSSCATRRATTPQSRISRFDWSPSQLLHRQIVIDRLAAARVDVLRQPASSSSGGSYSLPAPVVLRELRVERVDIAAPIAGTPVSIALDGSGALQTLTQGRVALNIRQLDGAGSYTLDGAMDAAGLHATLQASEPAHGMVAGIAGLPDLGAIDLAAQLDGPQERGRDACHPVRRPTACRRRWHARPGALGGRHHACRPARRRCGRARTSGGRR